MRAEGKVALLVSIDPGLSTGVAIFDNGKFVRSYTTHAPHDRLRLELQSLERPDEVACERGPSNHRRQAQACEPVEAIVAESCSVDVVWIRPTEWKGTPDAILAPSDSPSNKHERDATRMARWKLAR